MRKIKIICFSLAIVISLGFISATASTVSAAGNLEKKVFRLHVIGASNSVNDQMLKLKVRDGILKSSEELFQKANNSTEAKQIAQDNLEVFQKAAQEVLTENNSSYSCTVSVENTFFPTKEYENNIVLPAGNYDALVVKLGQAKGENWWCVMFPEICLSGSVNKQMKDVLKDDELQLTEKPKTKSAKLKFKTVEIYNIVKEGIKEITEK